MNISAIQLIEFLADQDQLVIRFAAGAIVKVIGHDRANQTNADIKHTEIDAAIAAIDQPVYDEYDISVLIGADPQETYMREAHAANLAAHVIGKLHRFA